MVKKEFSKHWKASSQPRKQRKYRYNAPLHIKSKFLNAHLSRELREKYKIRNVRVRKGDKVKTLRGNFKKQEGKVEKVNIKKGTVFIEKIQREKKEGSKAYIPIHPSNLMIIELDLEDKIRRKKIEKKIKNEVKETGTVKK